MNNRFLAYALIIALVCSLASWSSLNRRAMGGTGSGNSWNSSWHSSSSSTPGYSGWGGGGGHK
jgi:hypothetical protein